MNPSLPENKTATESRKITDCIENAGMQSKPEKIGISALRFFLAAVLALIADIISFIFPPAAPVVDLLIAPFLIVVLGFHWEIIPVILIELIPGLGVAPSWIVFVIYLYCRFIIDRKK